jgi:hypothetical protein
MAFCWKGECLSKVSAGFGDMEITNVARVVSEWIEVSLDESEQATGVGRVKFSVTLAVKEE